MTFQRKDRIVDRPHNVCGVVLRIASGRVKWAYSRISELPGVELFASTDDGRVVAVIEDVPGLSASDNIACLSDIDGVLSVSLVYHYFGFDQSEEVLS